MTLAVNRLINSNAVKLYIKANRVEVVINSPRGVTHLVFRHLEIQPFVLSFSYSKVCQHRPITFVKQW